ncbi:hypothetical protein POX_f08512 [Penicillium oxalicum]|uniref:hypothetical protein n=1 Tax=Penicillium oxalicum TaxID=69781 RepID=UPI0020B78282|nr:hypothetical protein POX_f08512 [Penicillium oxalicum]KAI2788125.1 hypothetical protein POX_f08512 [Penicillium oxalicum]
MWPFGPSSASGSLGGPWVCGVYIRLYSDWIAIWARDMNRSVRDLPVDGVRIESGWGLEAEKYSARRLTPPVSEITDQEPVRKHHVPVGVRSLRRGGKVPSRIGALGTGLSVDFAGSECGRWEALELLVRAGRGRCILRINFRAFIESRSLDERP